MPTPVKEGFVFVGWFDNPDGVGTPLTVLPVGYVGTLYAIWTTDSPNAVVAAPMPLNLNAPLYDLLGRQVNASYRGIVIQNGQTYLVR